LPPFTHKNGAMVELHWNLSPPDSPLQVDLDGLWERASPIRIYQREVLALSPEDLFLHLCVHACFHLQTGLGLVPLCDLAGMIKASAGAVDWPILIERAARWGCRKCVYLMLLLVRELMGAAPPERILSEIKPDDYRPAFLEEALEQIFDGNPSDEVLRKNVGKLAKITQAKGLIGKFSILIKAAFPSRAYLATIYPISISSPKIYLCYVYRLVRLTVQYAIILLRLYRRDRSALKAADQEHRVSTVSNWMYS
jgi:hypothetical protein